MLSEIRILVASADSNLRSGLRTVLEDQSHMRVVGEHASGRQALKAVRKLEPDVLLLDLVLDDMSGLDVLRQLDRSKNPHAIVLGDELDVYDQTQAALWGASGAIRTAANPTTLFKCIRSVLFGELWFGRDVMRALSERTQSQDESLLPDGELAGKLTKREMDVLERVAQGMSNHQIATRLQISESTIKHHLTHIFSKLRVSNRLELALLAAKNGLSTSTQALAGAE